MEDIKYSVNNNIGMSNLHDVAPERMVKIYPYELPNAQKAQEFIGGQTTSIVYLTQDALDTKDEHLMSEEVEFVNDSGEKEKKKVYYLEALVGINSSAKLDFSASTSTMGMELKEEDEFTALSNWYYEGEFDDIRIGNMRFMPCVFTVGRHFVESDYEQGNQAVFIAPTMVEAKEGKSQYSDIEIDPEGLYEFSMINTTVLEATFTNSKIQYTDQADMGNQIFPSVGSPVAIELENHTLLHSIKGKGTVRDVNSPKTETEFTDIDFFSEQAVTPIKMTPTSVADKLTMYASWFDYNSVLPWVDIEKFTSGTSKKNSLSELVTNGDDFLVIEKMLVISAGFADSWDAAPRLNKDNGSAAGKIEPDWEVLGTKIVGIEGADPIKVVDGIYEAHLRKHPEYLLDVERQRALRGALAALSRFIYSSYCIGRGQNLYNSLYLPWYLTLGQQLNYDQWNAGSNITVFAQTNFFKQNYTSLEDFDISRSIELPTKVNLSNQVLLMSDRPTTMPELPYTVGSISKLPLPGDINTKDVSALAYTFYLPISDPLKMRKLYIDSKDLITSKGADQTFHSKAFTVSGNITQEEANIQVINRNPGSSITVPPIITYSSHVENYKEYPNKIQTGTQNVYNGITKPIYTYRWPDGTPSDGSSRDKSRVVMNTAVGSATLSTSSDLVIKDYSIGKRELLFDKDAWETFLFHFDIIPDAYIRYDLDVIDTASIVHIDELIISSVWGNYIDIKIGLAKSIRVQLFNQDDETIGTQRIIFS